MHANETGAPATEITFTTVSPTRPVPDMADEVRDGLLSAPRSIPPKYFYDERGSALFDQICATPEYYPTRTEHGLLSQYANDIIDSTRPAQILELGSGYSVKTRRLFDACEAVDHHCGYAPFDVCEAVLLNAAKKLSAEYDWLELNPLLGDYHAGLGNLPKPNGTRLFIFLGSSIGNFEQDNALRFIQEIYHVMAAGDYLLLGMDRVKEQAVLQAAYNDEQGLTAEFNLNVLSVINHRLDADFNPATFRHSAIFNTEQERIEMRLVSKLAQEVTINDLDKSIRFNAEDDILTEISQKYTYKGIESMLTRAGLTIRYHFEDEQSYFSLVLAGK